MFSVDPCCCNSKCAVRRICCGDKVGCDDGDWEGVCVGIVKADTKEGFEFSEGCLETGVACVLAASGDGSSFIGVAFTAGGGGCFLADGEVEFACLLVTVVAVTTPRRALEAVAVKKILHEYECTVPTNKTFMYNNRLENRDLQKQNAALKSKVTPPVHDYMHLYTLHLYRN